MADGTCTREIYRDDTIHERHRHRYEVNNQYRQQLVDAGLVVSGTFQEGRPLSRSWSRSTTRGLSRASSTLRARPRPTRPAPLFREFVGAAAERGPLLPEVGLRAAG